MALAGTGGVLGIDVGFSATRRTTCLCLMMWDKSHVRFNFELCRADDDDRNRGFSNLGIHEMLDAVAVDGPLVHGLKLIKNYRAAEALLSRGSLQKRGKPGQTSSPTGQQLHIHATGLAEMAIKFAQVSEANYPDPIHPLSICEAFPNMFLASLIDEVDLPTLSRNASDVYWEILVRNGGLYQILDTVLPGRRVMDLGAITNHEHRAGVVCALTALSVADRRYVAVGDPEDGDIILPSQSHWGSSANGREPWMRGVLDDNLHSVSLGSSPSFPKARVLYVPEG